MSTKSQQLRASLGVILAAVLLIAIVVLAVSMHA